MPKINFLKIINTNKLLIFLFILIILIYKASINNADTPYNYFILLAQSFLKANLHLEQSYPWLNELIPAGINKWYVVYPPMPALVSIPFVLINITNQTLISFIFGVFNFLFFYLLLKDLYDKKIAILLALAFILGTNHWYLSTDGSVWYFSHIVSVFFLILSLKVLHLTQKDNKLTVTLNTLNWLISGLLLGASYWSRLPTILAFPFFIYLLFSNRHLLKNKFKKALVLFLLGLSLFVLLNFLYNYLRFNTIFDVAYQKIPGVLEEPWYSEGIFSTKYFLRNVKFILTKLPRFSPSFPYFKPSIEGMALIATSPFLLLILFVNRQKIWALFLIITGILMLMPGLLHGTVGFSQFGYRFGLEASLMFLLSLGTFLTSKKRKIIFTIFLLLAILINLWGLLFIRFWEMYEF